MSKRVLEALESLGLSETDAEVYVHLARMGSQDAESIAEALRLKNHQLCEALENLKNKGIVKLKIEHSTLFSALPFNEALRLLVKTHLEEAREIESNKEAHIQNWQEMVREGAKKRNIS